MVVVIALIAAVAFFVQAYAGFGAALILTPLLALVIDLKTGIVAAAVVQVPIGIWLAYGARHAIYRPALWVLLPISVIGLVAGTSALVSLDVLWLKRLCGLFTALFALDVLRRALRRDAARAVPRWLGMLAGLAGGLLGGLFGASGPPVVAYLERSLDRAALVRGTLLAYFLVINLLRVIGYAVADLYSPQVALTAATMLPAAALGAWAGATLQRRASEGGFRIAMAMVLLITGVGLAAR